jgi:hypothetical protein
MSVIRRIWRGLLRLGHGPAKPDQSVSRAAALIRARRAKLGLSESPAEIRRLVERRGRHDETPDPADTEGAAWRHRVQETARQVAAENSLGSGDCSASEALEGIEAGPGVLLPNVSLAAN